MKIRLPLLLAAALLVLRLPVHAQSASAGAQAKIDAQAAAIATWAAEPIVVAAVRAHNAALPLAEAALDQRNWTSLATSDPLTRTFTKNPVGAFLRSKRSAIIVEAFVSDAAGFKVGFIEKPTRWCHAGVPKHDLPMAGKSWQGRMEFDASTGLRQIQISVPVLDAGKPIGSLVVGLSTAVFSE